MKREEKKQEEPQGNLFVTPLEEVLPSAMLPYAEFVILDRALPKPYDRERNSKKRGIAAVAFLLRAKLCITAERVVHIQSLAAAAGKAGREGKESKRIIAS